MTLNTAALLLGHLSLLILFGALWVYLPAPGGGKPRFAETPGEPLVLAAFSAGFAAAVAMIVVGYLNYFV
jgi:hypothetical protein